MSETEVSTVWYAHTKPFRPSACAFADTWYKTRQDVEALERGTAASRIYYGDPVASGTVRAFRLADLSIYAIEMARSLLSSWA